MKREERTLKERVEFSGIGIHTGEMVKMAFCPAESGQGIQFERVDLPGRPRIKADLAYVVDTTRSTTLGTKECVIHTVEHVLAALSAYGVDNLVIELSNLEPPVGNGGSDLFVEMIEKAGVQGLGTERILHRIKEPIFYSSGDISLVALPHDGFKLSYTLHYPGVKPLEAQFHSVELTTQSFKEEIAPCRTFALWEEISWLIDKGYIRGGSLANAVVVVKDAVLSKGGLHFKNEAARHKILDMVGDFSLTGIPFLGHVISIRSGHTTNFGFAKELKNYFSKGA